MKLVTAGIVGATGRMGRELLRTVPKGVRIAAVDLRDVGAPLRTLVPDGPDGNVGGKFEELASCDVLIDFSAPQASVEWALRSAAWGTPLILGTTGMSLEQKDTIHEAARKIPIVMETNFSQGVAVLGELVARAASRLGEDFDIEVLETHHRRKVDAPSGTAVSLLELVDAVRPGREHVFERVSRGARKANETGVLSLRGGDVVGEHTVFFFGEGERIEITHRATDRAIFARGAWRAAQWVLGREPGLYRMHDVLSG